jgi:hypothetical protein
VLFRVSGAAARAASQPSSVVPVFALERLSY